MMFDPTYEVQMSKSKAQFKNAAGEVIAEFEFDENVDNARLSEIESVTLTDETGTEVLAAILSPTDE